HLAHRGAVLGARVELSVGERSRPALAEAVVRGGVEIAAADELGEIVTARLHRFSQLDDRDARSRLRETQRGKGSRRPGADDHHPLPRRDPGDLAPRLGRARAAALHLEPKRVTDATPLARIE